MSINDTLDTEFWFSGSGVAAEAELGAFHVAIGGHTYLIDVTRYQRTILPATTAQNDDGAEVTERSLSREAFWVRHQTDWSSGAGQVHFDNAEADRTRFDTSKGVDIWTADRLCLLPETETTIADASSTNFQTFSVDGLFYYAHTNTLSFGADPGGTLTDIVFADPIADVTTDGNRVYVAFGAAAAVQVATVGSGSAAAFGAETPDIIQYANGRLLAATGNEIYELDGTGTKLTIKTDFRADFVWDAIDGVAGHAIFAAGHVGDVGEFWATTVDSGGALAAPTFAGHLPFGETALTLRSYAGVMAIGTDKGFRAASIADLALFYGNLIEVGPVRGLAVRDRFCWFTWTDFDGVSTGLGRADLSFSTSTATFVPPYASDLMATAQGNVADVTIHDGDPYFAVVGVGVVGPTGNLVTDGYLETGAIRYSVLPPKVFTAVDIHHEPLAGIVGAEAIRVDGTEKGLGANNNPGATESHLASAQVSGRSMSLRLLLLRDITDPTQGPCVRAWTLHGLPKPSRVIEIIVPVVIKTKVTDLNGRQRPFDPLAEIRFLEGLAENAELVTYQEGAGSYLVRVDAVGIGEGDVRSWQRRPRREEDWFEAMALVRMLSRERP